MSTPSQKMTQDDEIDLFDLIKNIWQEKLLIIVITAVTTILALFYALTATPVYQTSSVLTPATTKDLDELNSTSLFTITPESALDRVGASLESWGVRFSFFQQNKDLFKDLINENLSDEQNFLRINQEFKLNRPDEKSTGFSNYVGITLEYPEATNGPAIVNGLVNHAINAEKTRIEEDIDTSVNSRLRVIEKDLIVLFSGYSTGKQSTIAKLSEEDTIKQLKLQDELAALRESLKTRRENRIKTLEEAIIIANSLGIKKPTSPSGMSQADTSTSGSIIRTEINNQQFPLYFMGTEALEAEKAMLEARTNDDFTSGRIVEIQQELMLLENNRQIETLNNRQDENLFLTEIADKQQEITLLSNIDIDYDKLQLVRIDKQASQAANSIKPNKKLILALGILLGGVIGVFVALLRSTIRNRQLAQS